MKRTRKTKLEGGRNAPFWCSGCSARGKTIHLWSSPASGSGVWLCFPCARTIAKVVAGLALQAKGENKGEGR